LFRQGIGKRELAEAQNFGAVMAECNSLRQDAETRSALGFLEKPTPKLVDRKRNRAGQ
jgi:hypothetical protein